MDAAQSPILMPGKAGDRDFVQQPALTSKLSAPVFLLAPFPQPLQRLAAARGSDDLLAALFADLGSLIEPLLVEVNELPELREVVLGVPYLSQLDSRAVRRDVLAQGSYRLPVSSPRIAQVCPDTLRDTLGLGEALLRRLFLLAAQIKSSLQGELELAHRLPSDEVRRWKDTWLSL